MSDVERKLSTAETGPRGTQILEGPDADVKVTVFTVFTGLRHKADHLPENQQIREKKQM